MDRERLFLKFISGIWGFLPTHYHKSPNRAINLRITGKILKVFPKHLAGGRRIHKLMEFLVKFLLLIFLGVVIEECK